MKKGQSGCVPDSFFGSDMFEIFSKNARFKSSSPFLIRQIEYYQQFIDPKLKKKLGVRRICRYSLTCSEYTKNAIRRYGAVRGIAMGVKRIARCGRPGIYN